MRIKITNEGDVITHVTNAETGETVPVKRIELTQDAGELPECKLVLAGPVELEVEVDTEAMCGEPAVEVCLWPDGKEVPVCASHAAWAAKVLRTLGSSYNSRPAKSGEICTQKVSEV